MRYRFPSAYLLAISVLVATLAANPSQAQDQTAPPQNGPAASSESVSESLRSLQEQVSELKSLVIEMRGEVSSSRAETLELRRELAASGAVPESTATGGTASGEETQTATASSTEQRLAKLEDDQALLNAKVDDQYQTKVESASKYRVRFSGIALLNLYDNIGAVDNQDYPSLAVVPVAGQSGGAFGGSLRQSEFGVEVFGPDLAGAKTSANVQFDFGGGFSYAPNGVTFGLVRLRTGDVRFDWGNTSVIAGQDPLFISPLAASSFASLAIPALSYSGELWSWTPQIRVEHHFAVSDASEFLLQAGILDSLSGEVPVSSYYRQPLAGEASRAPAVATRLSWSRHAFGRSITVGTSGYYGRQNWGFGHNVDGWATVSDWTFPLGPRFDLSGEFYRGRGVGGLGASAYFNGPMNDSATTVSGLNSMGGWSQLKFHATTKLEFNGAFGQDNPFADDVRSAAPWQQVYFNPSLTRNQSALANFIYRPRSDLLFSVEYLHLRTFTLSDDSYSAQHVSANVGVLF